MLGLKPAVDSSQVARMGLVHRHTLGIERGCPTEGPGRGRGLAFFVGRARVPTNVLPLPSLRTIAVLHPAPARLDHGRGCRGFLRERSRTLYRGRDSDYGVSLRAV